MAESLYFFVEKQPVSDTHTKYTYVSTNPYSQIPFKETILPTDANKDKENMPFGSLFDCDVLGKWAENTPYLKHDYELAVVLAYNPRNDTLFVFGNKIGDQRIAGKPLMAQECGFYNTGDRVLLHKSARDIRVLHNISHSILRSEIKKLAR